MVGSRIAPRRFLLFAFVFVIAGAIANAFHANPRVVLLVAFDVAALVFLASIVPLLDDSAKDMRRTAELNDANRLALLAVNVLLLLVILIAVGSLIASPTSLGRTDVILIVVSLILAWLFANMVFTLHYAHLYYLQAGGKDARGLEFPGATEPNYWDFLYFSFTLGMTFQTSDVTINGSHMRKIVLLQSAAAFVFNMGILGFTVNALGSL